jgi:hypothetical protein
MSLYESKRLYRRARAFAKSAVPPHYKIGQTSDPASVRNETGRGRKLTEAAGASFPAQQSTTSDRRSELPVQKSRKGFNYA